MSSEANQIERLQASIKTGSEGRLHGKICIITGGASSIGRAICLAYAKEGAAHVVVADLRPTSRDANESSVTTHDLINKAGGKASFRELDVTKPDEFEAVVQDTAREHGRLDVLVNNAGVAPGREQGGDCPIWEASDSSFDFTMKPNAYGVFYGTRSASKVMVNQSPGPSGDQGWIINLASIYGLVGYAGIAAYNASKFACMGITRSAALDCAPYRVHVNAICPGYVQTALTERQWTDVEKTERITRLHPFRGLGRAEDIAPIAVFLASEDCRWVTGTGIAVDGGYVCQ